MSRPQIIHSGHFMVSEPHAELDPDPDPDPNSEAAMSPAGQASARLPQPGPCMEEHGQRRTGSGWKAAAGKALDGAQQGGGATYDFGTVDESTCLIYRYGPRSSGALNIDSSLTKLFECMTLAYSGKLVSPKWKNFKGLKLLQRDKIRLNNAIWRAWYLQYVEKGQNPVCSFVTPLECSDIDEHRRPEAIIMEEKYWKCQIGVVGREYRRWRTFYHTRVKKKMNKPVSGLTQEAGGCIPGLELNGETASGNPVELDPLHELNAILGTIFSSRTPFGGPNLRGLDHQGNADMIQPTLTQLHPFFGEEFMDTMDPIHELITTCHSQPTVQAPAPLTDAAALGPCGSDVSPAVPGAKELLPEDSFLPVPISLDVEPPPPLNGQQTFLPFFPTSPWSISPPPPAPPLLHIQPQTSLVFSVITHTGPGNKPSVSSPAGTFAVPSSVPTAKSGRCRPLQRIAPAPSSGYQPGPPSAFLTHLLTTGLAPLPLTLVMNSTQERSTSASVILGSVSPTEKSPLPDCAMAAAFSNAGAKTKERATNKTLCNLQERNKRYTAKRSCQSNFPSADCARRMVIRSGFNTLANLVLPGSDQINAKFSKAALLQKSVAYVSRLQQERQQAQETAERLRGEIEELSAAIDVFQHQLPPTGAPVLPPQSDWASQLYDEYVHQRTLQDWRFWLFSVVIKPLFETYTRTVNTGNLKEFCQSVLRWLEQHCALPVLRPAISGSLLQLSKITSILTQPAQLPEQALKAASCPSYSKGNS